MEEKKEEFKIKLNALELKLEKLKNNLMTKSGKILGRIEENGKIKLSQQEFDKIFENMIKGEIDKRLIPFEKSGETLKIKDDVIIEINDELAGVEEKALIEFEDLELDLERGEEDEKEILTGEKSDVSIKKEIANKNKLNENDIVSVIVIKDKEDASYLFKEDLQVPGQVKIVRDINDNCIIVNEENEKIMGYEATKPAMELIDKLNLYRSRTSEVDYENIDRGRTEGQDYDDIIMITNENHPNIQWLIDNGPDGKRKAEIFEVGDKDEIRQIETESIFPAEKNIKLSDREIDVKKREKEKKNDIFEIEKTGQEYTEMLRKELIETQKRINELKKQYDGKEVDINTAGEVASEMKMLTDKMKFLQQEFSKTENVRLDLTEGSELTMEVKKDNNKIGDDDEEEEYGGGYVKVPWPTE